MGRDHYSPHSQLRAVRLREGEGLWPQSQEVGKLGFELRPLLPGPKLLPTAGQYAALSDGDLQSSLSVVEMKPFGAGDYLSPTRRDRALGPLPAALAASFHGPEGV